jgi:hypothetical protein
LDPILNLASHLFPLKGPGIISITLSAVDTTLLTVSPRLHFFHPPFFPSLPS